MGGTLNRQRRKSNWRRGRVGLKVKPRDAGPRIRDSRCRFGAVERSGNFQKIVASTHRKNMQISTSPMTVS